MNASANRLLNASAQALCVLHEVWATGHAIRLSLVENLSRYVYKNMDSAMGRVGASSREFERAALACLGLARAGKSRRDWLDALRAAAPAVATGEDAPGLAYAIEAISHADSQAARDWLAEAMPRDLEALSPRQAAAWRSAKRRIDLGDGKKNPEGRHNGQTSH